MMMVDDNDDDNDGNDDDDVGQPSCVLLYALPGWVERLNFSWMVLLNAFPVIRIE